MAAELRATLVMVDNFTPPLGRVVNSVTVATKKIGSAFYVAGAAASRAGSAMVAAASKIGSSFSNVGRAVFSLRSTIALLGGYAVMNALVRTAMATDGIKDRFQQMSDKWEAFKSSIVKAGVGDWIADAFQSIDDQLADSGDHAKSTAALIVQVLSPVGQVIGAMATGIQLVVQGFAWGKVALLSLMNVINDQMIRQSNLFDPILKKLKAVLSVLNSVPGMGGPGTRLAASAVDEVLALHSSAKLVTDEFAKQRNEAMLTAMTLSNQQLAHVAIFNAIDDANKKYKDFNKTVKSGVGGKVDWSEKPGGSTGDGPWIGESTKADVLAQQWKSSDAGIKWAGTQDMIAAGDKYAASIEAQNAALEKQRSLYEGIRGMVESIGNIIGGAVMNFMDDLMENKVKPIAEYLKDILKDMAKFLMQLAMQKLISAASSAIGGAIAGGGSVGTGINQMPLPMGGAAQGGILPSPFARIPMRAFASGGMTPGITNGAEMWLVGEGNRGRKREAIIPLENNRHVKAVVQDGGGNTIVNNNIYALDTESFEAAMTRQRRSVRIAHNMNNRENPRGRR